MLLNCGVGEDSWESLDCKEIQPVHPKGNQSWIFIGRTDAEAETPILWPLDEKNWLIWKNPDAGKDWRQEEKGMTEDKMVGWHHRLDGHEFEQALGVGDGQGSLACCSPCGCRVGHDWVTELKTVSTSPVTFLGTEVRTSTYKFQGWKETALLPSLLFYITDPRCVSLSTPASFLTPDTNWVL